VLFVTSVWLIRRSAPATSLSGQRSMTREFSLLP
jgi:hypothetical protein